jgi:hypothetical protein
MAWMRGPQPHPTRPHKLAASRSVQARTPDGLVQRSHDRRRLILALVCVQLSLVAAPLVASTSASAHPSAGASRTSKSKCEKKKSHSKNAKACKSKPKRHKKPTSVSGKPAEKTTSPGPVNLTPAEQEAFNTLNQERAAAHVEPLATSPVLQAIAEKRVHEMAAMHADYAGHDVVVDLKDEPVCTRAQREISGISSSPVAAPMNREKERQEIIEKLEHGARMADLRARPPISEQMSEEEIELTIPIDPTYKVVGVAILEAGEEIFRVEDFAEPC